MPEVAVEMPGLPAGLSGVHSAGPDVTFCGGDPVLVVYDAAGERVGHLLPYQGRVFEVWVAPAWRRQGVAAALWAAARLRWTRLRHARPDELTADGWAWAYAMGGPGRPSGPNPPA